MLSEIVVKISKKSNSSVGFPFGRDFGEFEAALLKQKKLPMDVIAMIRTLQPYNGGDPLLWMLHNTNNRDKHRFGLVPINLARRQNKLPVCLVWYGLDRWLSRRPALGQ